MIQEYTQRAMEFLYVNAKPLATMVMGMFIGESDASLFHQLSDPATIDLIKNYVSIFCTLGGFLIVVYNTFFKNDKKISRTNSKDMEDSN